MTRTDYWLSSSRMTVLAVVDGGILVETAPVTRRFLGQPAKRLAAWMKGQGGFQWSKLPTDRK